MKHEIGITVQLAKSRTENKFNMATNDGSGRVTEQIKLKGRCWFVGCGQGVSHVGLDQSPAGTHGLQDGERGWLAGKNEDVRVLPGGPAGDHSDGSRQAPAALPRSSRPRYRIWPPAGRQPGNS